MIMSSLLSSLQIFTASRGILSTFLFLESRLRISEWSLVSIELEGENTEKWQTEAVHSSVLQHCEESSVYVEKLSDHTDFISTKADHIWVGKVIFPAAWRSHLFSLLVSLGVCERKTLCLNEPQENVPPANTAAAALSRFCHNQLHLSICAMGAVPVSLFLQRHFDRLVLFVCRGFTHHFLLSVLIFLSPRVNSHSSEESKVKVGSHMPSQSGGLV